jgi:16S rRNA (cytosine967-C5)-methyltransferase
VRSRCRLPRSRACWISEATAARRAALEILRAVHAGIPFAAARDQAVGGLSARDRHLAHELSAGVLRARRTLDATLDITKVDQRLRDILRLGAYQLQRLDRIPAHAAVSTSVELARHTAGEAAARYVNQALRKLGGRGACPERSEGTAGEGRVGTHPDWLVERWRERFGSESTARLLEWNDARRPLVLQPVKWNTARLVGALESVGFQVAPVPFDAGFAVTVSTTAPPSLLPSTLPGYSDGAFIVQDPAQALVCRFAAVPGGARLYDACAAPGGKSVILALGGALVTAGDRRPDRLRRLADSIGRARVPVTIVAADLLASPWRSASWDAVFVDAPCSATGTMARHPDARWRLTARAIEHLSQRQSQLLDAAGSLVRPGGVLTYATCSLEAEENENQVDDFLRRQPEFRRAPLPGPQAVPAELMTPAGDFCSRPWLHGIDGAYAARLERDAR